MQMVLIESQFGGVNISSATVHNDQPPTKLPIKNISLLIKQL